MHPVTLISLPSFTFILDFASTLDVVVWAPAATAHIAAIPKAAPMSFIYPPRYFRCDVRTASAFSWAFSLIGIRIALQTPTNVRLHGGFDADSPKTSRRHAHHADRHGRAGLFRSAPPRGFVATCGNRRRARR